MNNVLKITASVLIAGMLALASVSCASPGESAEDTAVTTAVSETILTEEATTTETVTTRGRM